MGNYSLGSKAHGAESKTVEYAYDWYKNAGGIVQLCWHWTTPEDYAVNAGDQPWYSSFYKEGSKLDLDKIMNGEDDAAYQLLMDDIDNMANELARLRDAGVPVLWRPLHEAAGGWFWWGKGGADCFIRLWRMMYERFTQKFNLNNLIWVLGYAGDVKDGWYVGDDYCDIVGSDTYDGTVNRHGYDRLTLIAPNKPKCFHECGILPQIGEFKQSGCMWMWFMIWHTRWLYDNGEESLKAYYNSENAITLEDIGINH